MGMCLDGEWYHLLAKTHTYDNTLGQTDIAIKETNYTDGNKRAAGSLDVAILQELVLSPVFGIHDPKTDSRLKCAGGEKALEEIAAIFQEYPGAIAFTLCPLTVGQLMAVADAGDVLPPKSTWIVPKVPYGLLIHQH